jgi:peptide/nickel transport system ATP-binding protein
VSKQPNSELLRVEDLVKIFHIQHGLFSTSFSAVDGMTFTLDSEKPEIFTIAGESGSGKTTVARMLLGMELPTGGVLQYKGREVAKLSGKDKRKWFFREVQPVFQDPFAAFSPLKRVDRYLYETVENFKMAPKKGVDAYIDEKLVMVGLTLKEIKGRYPHELSGGQAQRVAVARALLTNPSLIVADEPVSMLDASLRMSIVNMFRRLKDEEQVNIVYITHDLATAFYSADRIAIMLRGWNVEMGPVEEVLGVPLHPYSRNLKESIPLADPDKTWQEKTDLATMDTEEYLATGCRFAARCPRVMDICRTQPPDEYQARNRMVKCFLYDEKTVGADEVANNIAQEVAASQKD